MSDNIERWRKEEPPWFKIEMIDDEFLPIDVFASEGGFKRRRESVDAIIPMSGRSVTFRDTKVHPAADKYDVYVDNDKDNDDEY